MLLVEYAACFTVCCEMLRDLEGRPRVAVRHVRSEVAHAGLRYLDVNEGR